MTSMVDQEVSRTTIVVAGSALERSGPVSHSTPRINDVPDSVPNMIQNVMFGMKFSVDVTCILATCVLSWACCMITRISFGSSVSYVEWLSFVVVIIIVAAMMNCKSAFCE